MSDPVRKNIGWICLRQIAFVPNAGALPPAGEERPLREAETAPSPGRSQRCLSSTPIGAALIRKDARPGLRSKQSPGRGIRRGFPSGSGFPMSDPVRKNIGWICLRQIAFVPNAGALPPAGEERPLREAETAPSPGRSQRCLSSTPIGAALIRKDARPGLRSKQSPGRGIRRGFPSGFDFLLLPPRVAVYIILYIKGNTAHRKTILRDYRQYISISRDNLLHRVSRDHSILFARSTFRVPA